jgi:hypothetical protein
VRLAVVRCDPLVSADLVEQDRDGLGPRRG